MARTTQTARKTTSTTVARPRVDRRSVPSRPRQLGEPAPRMRLAFLGPPNPQAVAAPPPSAIDSVMRAVVAQKGGVSVQDYPTPKVGDEDVLVKVVAVALSRADCKILDSGRANRGTVLGCDFSGTVAKLGSAVSGSESQPNLELGAHVVGFTLGGVFDDAGAFAQYVCVPAALVCVIPEGQFQHEEAATMGSPLWTAHQAFFRPDMPGISESDEGEDWIYVHGGSCPVGLHAIQLAKRSRWKVVATTSSENFELLKSFGATEVFDILDQDVVSKIKAATGDSITAAFDPVGTLESQTISAAVLSSGPDCKVIHTHPVIPDATARTDVVHSYADVFLSLGRDVTYANGEHFSQDDEGKLCLGDFMAQFHWLLNDGTIQPLPFSLGEGGLDGIEEGLLALREGLSDKDVIVYRI